MLVPFHPDHRWPMRLKPYACRCPGNRRPLPRGTVSADSQPGIAGSYIRLEDFGRCKFRQVAARHVI